MAEKSQQNWHRVWIVGASSGIGEALALKFAQKGVEVIASARREAHLDALAARSPNIAPLVVDVESVESVQNAVEEMAAKSILPDLTIFCAAIYEPGGLEVLVHEKARRHMSINYLGAVAVIEALGPSMQEAGRGDIAIVSSLTSYCGLPKASLYGPTKAALASLCETLKPDFDAAGLGLHLINPGFVATRLTEKNRFDMPFLMTSEQAADRILRDLTGNRFEIAFPTRLALSLRFLRLLPYSLYFRLMRKMAT